MREVDAKASIKRFLCGELPILSFWEAYESDPEIDRFLQQIVDNIKAQGGEMKPVAKKHPATGEVTRSVGITKYLLTPELDPGLRYGSPPRFGSVHQLLHYHHNMVTYDVHTASGALNFYGAVYELFCQIDDTVAYDDSYLQAYDFALEVIPDYLSGGEAEQYIQQHILPLYPDSMKKTERKKRIKAAIQAAFPSEKGRPCWAQSSQWPFGKDGTPATYLGKGKSDGDLRRWRFRDESTGEIIIVEQWL